MSNSNSNSNNYNSNRGSGMGTLVCGLLTIVLVVLKALGYVTFSWWLVFLPMYGALAVVLLLLAIAAVAIFIAALIETKEGK